MGYVPFSTVNADYILVYATHIRNATDDIFNDEKIHSLDAIILENTGQGPQMTETSQLSIPFLPPFYETIMKQSHKHKKLIYLLDANVSAFGAGAGILMGILPLALGTGALLQAKQDIREASEHEKTDRRQFLKGLGKGLFGMWLLNGYSGLATTLLTDGETPNYLETAASSVHRIPPNPFLEARNCVTARKTEEFVVPLLKKSMERKPKIAIVSGCFHSGMKECFQGKAWRDIVLTAYKEMNYLGLDIYTLNTVWEMWPSHLDYWDHKIFDQNWCSQYYNCKLF